MKNLIDLYKSMQASVGMTSDAEGFVSTVLPGSTTAKAFTIDGKRLVNPTPTQLQQPDWSNRIGFHPLLQKVQEGESRVIDKFRDRMNAYSDFMTGMFLINLAKLACEKEKHQSLSPSQAAYLGPMSDADEKFVKFLTSMVSAGRANKKNFEFVRFSLIKGRQFQGKKRSRVAVLHFPLYEALPKDGKGTTILNHKLRGIDVKMLRSIYEFLFPGINEKEAWEVPSDSLVAASMEALMSLYARYIASHNGAVVTLGQQIEAGEELLIVDDWKDDIAKIADYLPEIRKIPWLEGPAAQRVEVASAPQDIRMPQAQPAMASVNSAPVFAANAIPEPQPVQQVQEQPSPVRFKIGVKSPTVTDTTSHQISNQQAQQAQSINTYTHRPPAGQPAQVAPQQQPMQQQFAQPQQQQFIQPVQQVQPVQPQAPQAMKVPDTARLFNGQLYIPAQTTGISTPPVGALIIEDRLYVPLNQGMAGVAPLAGQPMAMARPNLPGLAPQQQITDPAQIPGLSVEEINYYRSNPVLFHNYLATLNASNAMQMQQNQMARHNTIPSYLQRASERAQQAQQQQVVTRSFFGR